LAYLEFFLVQLYKVNFSGHKKECFIILIGILEYWNTGILEYWNTGTEEAEFALASEGDELKESLRHGSCTFAFQASEDRERTASAGGVNNRIL